MDVDTDELAQQFYDKSFNAREVPLPSILPMLSKAFPGVDAIDEPGLYRWFVIEKFPVKEFGISREEMLKEVGSHYSDDLWRHNHIVDLLRSGEPTWPAFATANGILIDGYHRIAAHRTLKHKDISVVIAVRRPGDAENLWDELWNQNYP